MRKCTLAMALVVGLVFAHDCRAAMMTYGFYCITNNDAGDAAIGEAQLSVEVSDEYAGQALFTFKNTGADDSAITEFYFDNGSLLLLADVLDDPPNVVVVEEASPPNLPGGDLLSPAFDVTAGFLAQAVAPPPKRGVNPGEELGILFDLQGGGTYQTVIDELASGALRIGIHVTDFSSDGSESFVNVPEPATVGLMVIGLAAVLATRRKRL